MPLLSINDLRQRNSNTPIKIIRRAWEIPDDEKISEIVVVSAYTDVKALTKLVKELRSEETQSIKILLDYGASGYHRDEDTTSNLNKLSEEIGKRFSDNSGIFLVQIGRFLHSKIIHIKTNKERKLTSIGSLNFTFRGFCRNEEVIYNTKTDKTVIEYAENLEEGAARIPFENGNRLAFFGYRDWMLQGAMFYEDKETNPFNFKLNLPEDIRSQVSEITGLPAETPDNLTIFYVLDIPKSSAKMGWKKYCIQTCYGHWCPKQLIEETRSSIDKKIANTVKNRISPILTNKEDLKKKYLEKFDFIDKKINQYNLSNKTKYSWNKGEAIKRLDKWLEKTIKKLQNDDKLRRLIAGVSGPVVVPDFWTGDVLALREFEQSFCDHMVIELSKTRVQNWIALWFRDYFEFSDEHPFGNNWDEAWRDEDNWLSWLITVDGDPLKELPENWLEQ